MVFLPKKFAKMGVIPHITEDGSIEMKKPSDGQMVALGRYPSQTKDNELPMVLRIRNDDACTMAVPHDHCFRNKTEASTTMRTSSCYPRAPNRTQT
jgi:hypothetical protein